MIVRIKKGLDLPVSGKPEQRVHVAKPVRHVAVLGMDHLDLKPGMRVAEGDKVRIGQSLFEHKKLPGVRITAPGAGEVIAIRRGAERMLQSVIIRLDETEDEEPFTAYGAHQLASLTEAQVVDNLLASGLWVTLRTRPYSKIPDPSTRPAAIFVTAMDSNPLAADPVPIITAEAESFVHGLTVLSRLGTMPLWVCTSPEAELPLPQGLDQLHQARFGGPHPAGLAGTHIHFIEPVDTRKTVWHLNYQEVIAIGKLFTSGRLWTERIVALGGPQVKQPRVLRTRLGACIEELVEGELQGGEHRVISGSIWSGRHAVDWSSYLGRHHLQVCVLKEGTEREFMGWLSPGRRKYSQTNVMLSSLFRHRGEAFPFTTSQNGSPRAMVPFGTFEDVMPLDILPTQLLRYLLVGDTDMAQKLGCMELDEEDLALCSFVCVGKNDYGPVLRSVLSQIEREG
ncbi:MAG: Na(+)-translocating NADH-quinone reductase subunit A [Nitrospira sp.]|nr:Na(+)-translocating NADH-quinone reductase subunit A [Nitrospira sp.]